MSDAELIRRRRNEDHEAEARLAWVDERWNREARPRRRQLSDAYRDVAAVVIGRRPFDLTNGWNGEPAAGEHGFVVTHRPPTDWEHLIACAPGLRRQPLNPGGW